MFVEPPTSSYHALFPPEPDPWNNLFPSPPIVNSWVWWPLGMLEDPVTQNDICTYCNYKSFCSLSWMGSIKLLWDKEVHSFFQGHSSNLSDLVYLCYPLLYVFISIHFFNPTYFLIQHLLNIMSSKYLNFCLVIWFLKEQAALSYILKHIFRTKICWPSLCLTRIFGKKSFISNLCICNL